MMKYSFETEEQEKSERGKKPLSRSIKQIFKLFKFENLDRQRGEKTFSTRCGRARKMRARLFFESCAEFVCMPGQPALAFMFFSCNCSLSAMSAMNSELVGLPLALETV